MSRIRLNQSSRLAREAAGNLTPLYHLTQLQAAPTLLRTETRQWFGSCTRSWRSAFDRQVER